MNEQKALNVGPSRIEVAYERLGEVTAPPVLLIMGGGAQLVNWPDAFCQALVARGLQVIRFDNRDAGRSTHFPNAPIPDVPAALAGDLSSASYTLSDMAADAVGLLDALGIESAHLVGASLGGMIAQTMAIEFPARVRSLTSMLSTTGAPGVGHTNPEVFVKLAGPPPRSREEAMDRSVTSFRVIGSPGFELDEEGTRERAGRAFDRGNDPLGLGRQAVAVVASGDRTARLRAVRVPTLVIHGADDPMLNVSGGRATAEAIPGAELVVIPGMGHDLPRALWPRFVSLIGDLIDRAEGARGANMFKHVKFVNLPVVNQDRAIAFYTQKLGLELETDATYHGDWRWVELAIPGAQTRLLMSKRADETPDDVPSLIIVTDDVRATYDDLRGKGIPFTQEPTRAQWDPEQDFAMFRDTEGNLVMIGSK